MGRTYTGVALGSESLKLAVCDGDVIKSVLIATIPEGLVAGGRLVSFDAMADFIKQTVRSSRGISKDVAFVLPRTDVIVRHVTVPAMSDKELSLNLPYEFRDYILQDRDRYLYDYAVLGTETDPEGVPQRLDLLAAAVMKETVADYREMFRRAGLRLRVATPAQAAYQNLIGGNPSAKANCCVINFSHTAAKLHFFNNGRYDVTRVIEVGGADVDRAIAEALAVDTHIAITYKHTNHEGAQSLPAVIAVYESVAVDIQRALNFYRFNNPDAAIEVVYFGGGGSLLRPLMDTVAANIDTDLRPIADIMPPLQGGVEDMRGLCSSAVGATLKVG